LSPKRIRNIPYHIPYTVYFMLQMLVEMNRRHVLQRQRSEVCKFHFTNIKHLQIEPTYTREDVEHVLNYSY
jgi:hypothetical protein